MMPAAKFSMHFNSPFSFLVPPRISHLLISPFQSNSFSFPNNIANFLGTIQLGRDALTSFLRRAFITVRLDTDSPRACVCNFSLPFVYFLITDWCRYALPPVLLTHVPWSFSRITAFSENLVHARFFFFNCVA